MNWSAHSTTSHPRPSTSFMFVMVVCRCNDRFVYSLLCMKHWSRLHLEFKNYFFFTIVCFCTNFLISYSQSWSIYMSVYLYSNAEMESKQLKKQFFSWDYGKVQWEGFGWRSDVMEASQTLMLILIGTKCCHYAGSAILGVFLAT